MLDQYGKQKMILIRTVAQVISFGAFFITWWWTDFSFVFALSVVVAYQISMSVQVNGIERRMMAYEMLVLMRVNLAAGVKSEDLEAQKNKEKNCSAGRY